MVTKEKARQAPRRAGLGQADKDEDRITMLVSGDKGRRLRALAQQLEMPVSILMRRWILEKLEEEERRREDTG